MASIRGILNIQSLNELTSENSMVFQHSGGRDFDLPRHSHFGSGVISMVFQHSVAGPRPRPRASPGCGGAGGRVAATGVTPGLGQNSPQRSGCVPASAWCSSAEAR